MRVRVHNTRRARIEMLPLIDIVFLLLVFFIYAMLSMAVHRGLPVILPTSSTAKVGKHLVLSVTVRSDGAVYLDKQRVPPGRLTELLRKRSGQQKEAGVLLFADKSLPYQKLFQVLDEIRTAGLSRVSLQAQAEQ
ncbi:MAG: biopolymer transporter ExbD [Deltaproteobacteria bacterium]|nr:biopolymer transporter ExbD [Deltaproteobacteria bacterium]MBW1920922.1 biopolymer transporter ExbD [Deltaproteobacteria bacterium]MBW1934953.1 biopolymer transporter ExbD [Deltaproteobacteria bacterium]MBW1976819.1 biopolymer transporter ExbD [Deltaproteobacteria bacterium]MBW2043740.1 biopolymer transporter ExbD [Deltaproteobacteria bacterium]